MPQTIVDRLRDHASRVLGMLDALVDRSDLRDVNDPRSEVVFIGASYAWNELDDEGRRIQSRLLNELERYAPLVEALVRVAPEGERKDVADANETLRRIADRSHLSWFRTPEDARRAAHEAVDLQLQALESLDDPSDGRPIYVPDANAMIRSPNLDEWSFPTRLDSRSFSCPRSSPSSTN